MNSFRKNMVVALSMVLISCGSTDIPGEGKAVSGDYLIENLNQEAGVFSVAANAESGTGVSRENFFDSPEGASNVSFDLTLTEIGEEKGVTLYVNTDENLSSGYGIRFSLENSHHHPGEVTAIVGVLVDGEEQGGHYHLVEDVEAPVRLSLSLEVQPNQPHFVIMDRSQGNPAQNVLFDSRQAVGNLNKARPGQRLGFRIFGAATLSPQRPAAPIL